VCAAADPGDGLPFLTVDIAAANQRTTSSTSSSRSRCGFAGRRGGRRCLTQSRGSQRAGERSPRWRHRTRSPRGCVDAAASAASARSAGAVRPGDGRECGRARQICRSAHLEGCRSGRFPNRAATPRRPLMSVAGAQSHGSHARAVTRTEPQHVTTAPNDGSTRDRGRSERHLRDGSCDSGTQLAEATSA
jgi:hypothetical protein